MVMDYLPSTVDICAARTHEVLHIARAAVFGITDIHRVGIIHGGITERSLAFKDDQLVFVDFGRASGTPHWEDVSEEINDSGTCRIEVTHRSDLRTLALVLVSLTGATVPRLPRNPLAEHRVKFQDEVNNFDIDVLLGHLPLSLNPLRDFIMCAFALGIEEKPDYNLLQRAFDRT
ncbi:hypothetical protein SPBR_06232 [Sporothrix brasiliensis 5110]|uniref:Protein kinase domain-containing protein n=1 Tax=Sporothrix brasiliensis 5110 TaxID=1398154 RepID=A0A0C2IYR9_9PEZI|nr:uncharacterized protein SPBR_06232 [Sporothrix brasiliensis 5110]KIH94251.1 hypothetical protein SPBR_06232 [Sporothrix brasiliensis 5110]